MRVYNILAAFVSIFFLMPPAAAAEDKAKWTWVDTGLQVTAVGLMAADWAQTLHMARHPEKYYEDGWARPFIGKQPSEGRVNSYFAASIILNTVVAYLLPKPYRTGWQAITIGIEYKCIQKSRTVGIGMAMHF